MYKMFYLCTVYQLNIQTDVNTRGGNTHTHESGRPPSTSPPARLSDRYFDRYLSDESQFDVTLGGGGQHGDGLLHVLHQGQELLLQHQAAQALLVAGGATTTHRDRLRHETGEQGKNAADPASDTPPRYGTVTRYKHVPSSL